MSDKAFSNVLIGVAGLVVGLVLLLGPCGVSGFPSEPRKTEILELLPVSVTEGRLVEGVYGTKYMHVKSEFLQIAQGEEVRMAVDEGSVVYGFVVKGVSFRYTQGIPWAYGFNYHAKVEAYEIKDGLLVGTLERSNFALANHWFFGILGVVLMAVGLLVCIFPEPKKEEGPLTT